jgi:iduronate 2-sulfatase
MITQFFKVFSFWLLSVCSVFAQQQKPNILFIASDDLKPLLACYGEKQILTPNLDRLAKMGTVFLNNHCQQAICAPSRASLLTGKRPDATKVWDLATKIRDINPNITTLPQYFKQNGYFVTGIGKIYDNRSTDKQEDEPSWSEPYMRVKQADYAAGFQNAVSGFHGVEAKNIIQQKKKENEGKDFITGADGVKRVNYNLLKTPAFEGVDAPDEAYLDGVVARLAVAKLADLAKTNTPFFYAVGFAKPHLPFVAPKKYWDLYDRQALPLAPYQENSKNGIPFAVFKGNELINQYTDDKGNRIANDQDKISEALQRQAIHGYYACISYLDAQVGKLLDALERLQLDKNTIIVFWGDHGFHLGDHGRWAKHTNFEQATRSPLIIASPNHKGNQKTKSLSEFVDIFPTLIEMAGLPKHDGLDGKSLVPILKNPKTTIKPYAQSQYPRGDKVMGYTLRTTQYRYVAWFEVNFKRDKVTPNSKPVGVELYDYKKDPLETENFAALPQYQKIVEKHERLMRDFLANQN